MKNFSILLLTLIFFLMFYANNSRADNFTFELSANESALDSKFDAMVDVSNDSIVMPGIGGLYKSDNYKMLFLKALIGNEILIDGLTGGLGFKGIWGEAEKSYIDGNILNLGFACYASYDLSKSSLNDLPVILAASLCVSPEPLSFGDTNELIEVCAECNCRILDQAAIVLSYRYIEIDFENKAKWQKTDNAGYIGLKLFF